MKKLQMTVDAEHVGETVGMLLERYFGLTKRAIAKLRHYERGILINGQRVTIRRVVHYGDVIEVLFDLEEEKTALVPRKMDLDIIYEDEDLLVVNKPAGLEIWPTEEEPDRSLGNGVIAYLLSKGEVAAFHPVNRLEKDSTGLVLIAKNAYVYSRIDSLKLHKIYLVLVGGRLQDDGFIEAPIAQEREGSLCRCIQENGKYARTEYQIIARYQDFTEAKVDLTTGRMHQIRLHFSHIGHPLLGDSLYGGDCSYWKGHALHAYQLLLLHPVTSEKLVFEVEPPLFWRRFVAAHKNKTLTLRS